MTILEGSDMQACFSHTAFTVGCARCAAMNPKLTVEDHNYQKHSDSCDQCRRVDGVSRSGV